MIKLNIKGVYPLQKETDKTYWNNEFLEKSGAIYLLENSTLEHDKKINELEVIIKDKNYSKRNMFMLKVMLFNLKFMDISEPSSDYSLLCYNPNTEEFYIKTYFSRKEYRMIPITRNKIKELLDFKYQEK